MTKLETHANFESLVNPDDKKLSEDHNQGRIQQATDLAEARINEISRSRTGDKNGGIEGFFEDLEDHSISQVTPWRLAEQIKNRVMVVVGKGGMDTENASNGSSSSILDSSLWRYRRNDVWNNIGKIGRETKTSLTVVEGYEEMLSKAQAGALEQFENMKTKQEEIIEKRNWWQKTGRRILKVASLGTYALVERKRRQKAFNSLFEKAMTRRFEKLNENVAKLKKEATSRKDRMKQHMERVIKSSRLPNTKAALKQQLLEAVQYNGNRASGIDLSNWKSLSGNQWTEQEKVDFLEAAKEMDFVKNDLAALGISKQKNKEQKEMIKSAQDQQAIMTTPGNFKFEDVKNLAEFKDLPLDEKVLSTADLVQSIENQLQGNGIDVEKDIYGSAGDIKKSDLMVDTTRLVLLIKAISNDEHGAKIQINKSIKVKKSILTWIDKMDKDTGGDVEKYKNTKVMEQLRVLKNPPGLGRGNGIIKDTVKLLNDSKNVNKKEKAYLGTLKGLIDIKAADIQEKYSAFLNKEGDKDFPKEDFDKIKLSWKKVLESREFLVKQIDKWIKEQKEYETNNNDKSSKELSINARLVTLNGGTPGSIKDFEDQLTLLLVPGSAATKHQIQAAQSNFNNAKQEKIDLTKEYSDILAKKLPTFSGLDTNQKLLDELSIEHGIAYAYKITKEKDPTIIRLNERIQNEFATENFSKEIDKKFVENLAKNDQYETLKTVSEGTTVSLTYKEVGGTKEIKFPNQLNGSEVHNFIVFKKEGNAVHLRNNDGGDTQIISIVSAAAEGGTAYKNAIVRKSSGGADTVEDAVVGGAGEHAIVYNMKIAA